MDRSPGFGSCTTSLFSLYSNSVSLRLLKLDLIKLECNTNSPDHSSIGTISVAKGDLYRFVRKQFQVLFHWASRPSFRLSFSVLVHYRYLPIFSLGGWFPLLPPEYLHRGTWDIPRRIICFEYETFTLYGLLFQAVLLQITLSHWAPATPSH